MHAKLILALLVFAAFVFVYFMWVRPYLKALPRFKDLYAQEDTTYAAIKAWIDGRKTVLTGIWGTILGVGPDFLQIVSGVDLKTLLHLPDLWALWVSGIAVPMLMLVFRSVSSTAPPKQS